MKKFCLLFVAFMLLLTPVLASADDLNPPNFRDGDLSIYAVWDSFADVKVGDKLVFADTFITKPQDERITPAYIDLTSPCFGVKKVDSESGKITLNTDVLTIKTLNFDNDNPLKQIRLQITYGDNRALENINVIGGNSFDVKFIKHEDVDTYDVYSYADIFLYPNPKFEQLDLTFSGCGNLIIDQIVLDTQCVPAPVPGSLMLLGTGVLSLVRIGIRRKSA